MHIPGFLRSFLLGAGFGAGFAIREIFKQRHALNLRDRVVLITGGSRGLGLAIARECARQGARLVICARRKEALELARQKLVEIGADVLALSCDVSEQEQVKTLIEQTIAHFGRIDMLITCAGIITVGPQRMMTMQDYTDSMNIMFWGTVYPTLAVLPFMRMQRSGHIVHITSIGGKVSVPHLLPYSSAKFATLGFSEGMYAELAAESIRVTSVVPGLMRTGSHINALMKGHRQAEYAWFGFLATFPLTSTSVTHAARQIVRAARRGDPELIISPQAQFLARFSGLFPGLTMKILSLVNRILPQAREEGVEEGTVPETGQASRSLIGEWLTKLGEPAAHIYNQYARRDG